MLDLLPEGLLGEVYEFAGGRPVHPSARIMAIHIAETRNRLLGCPCFWESEAWDMTRMLRRHGWKRLKNGKWAGNRARTLKCTLPKRLPQQIAEPKAAEKIARKEIVCAPQVFFLQPLH